MPIAQKGRPLWRQMLLYFLPILMGAFFQQLYNTIDAMVVGKYVGKVALASVGGSTGTLINLLVGFFVGLASGSTVIIAQCFGAGDHENLSKAVHTGMALSIAGGAVLTLLGISLAGTALRWMGTPEEVLPQAQRYLVTYFVGIIPNLVYNIGAGILQAIGDSRRPLIFLVSACFVNIVLDLLFVAVLDFGVFGAALATILSQAVSAGMVLFVLLRTDGPHRLRLRQIRFHRRILMQIVRIGIPSGFQSSMYAISNVLIQSSINSFGTDVMAAYTAFSKLDAMCWMASGAFGTTVATFAGQFYGAQKLKQMKATVRYGLAMNAIFDLALSILMLTGGPYLLYLFLDDPTTIRYGTQMIRLITGCYALFIPCEIFSAVCRSVGDTFKPMLLTASGICGFRILWIFTVVAMWHEMTILFLCFPLSWVLTGGMFIAYYYCGNWMKVKPPLDSAAHAHPMEQTRQKTL